MDRRNFIGSLFTGMFSVNPWVLASSSRAGSNSRPNVLLIITDDQGYGDLGCHGNTILKTPHLDALYRDSVRFTQFCASPVCSPTRASLMTGRYAYRTGVVDTYAGRSMMDPKEITLAQLLQAAGYRTGIFGKWHLGDAYPLRPMDRGFDMSLVHFGGGIAQPSDPEFFERQDTYFNPVLQKNGIPTKTTGYCTDIFTDAALEFMGNPSPAPFFAYVAYNAPHTPLQVPKEYTKPYRDAGLKPELADFYGLITNLDENIGRLLTFLEKTGQYESTIVIFLTDNGGQSLGDNGRYNAGMRGWKGTVYEGGIRVPFFIRWPSAFSGGRDIDYLAAPIDITPTLVEMCTVTPGIDLSFDGRSLYPLLKNSGTQTPWPDRNIFIQWHRGDVPKPFKNCAVRGQRWKLINGEELYDLSADPGETRNSIADHPELAQKMRRHYQEWFDSVSADRGYAPVRIHIGNEHANPVLLTRQDWRTPHDWTTDTVIGHWELFIERAGHYDVEAIFAPADHERLLRIVLGNSRSTTIVPPGISKVVCENISAEVGPQRFECYAEHEKIGWGARFVRIKMH